jgi:hypothetical protein
MSATVLDQLRLLKAAYQMSGGWGYRGHDHYSSLVDRASRELVHDDHHRELMEIANVSEWQHAGNTISLSGEDSVAAHWQIPDDWTLPEEVFTHNGETNSIDHEVNGTALVTVF